MKSIVAFALVAGFLVVSCKKETTSTTTNTDTVMSDTVVETMPTDTTTVMAPVDSASTGTTNSKNMDTVTTRK
ncbi:hypothetical protein VUJ46_02905 [Chryseobacterium sp. MYb264]|uniref:hypothetical protein n=1 Tax=Chryseobacterium sp. MYb264 TaxID=2745153 RepID=UPI002E134B4C|nr:hypothetical protein VUJ46_02905 [Chryseobacterium sp. MYb264]